MIFSNETPKKDNSFASLINFLIGVIKFSPLALVGLLFTDYSHGVDAPKPLVVSASPLETQVDGLLNGKSKEEKVKFYKVFGGLADYFANSDRNPKNATISETVSNVIVTYKLENNTDFDALIKSKIKEVGLNGDESLKDGKERANKAFSELAEAVKYSIEHTDVK